MLREAERAAKLDKEMTSNNNKYIPVKSFESRPTIFLSYSFIQRARTRARSF